MKTSLLWMLVQHAKSVSARSSASTMITVSRLASFCFDLVWVFDRFSARPYPALEFLVLSAEDLIIRFWTDFAWKTNSKDSSALYSSPTSSEFF